MVIISVNSTIRIGYDYDNNTILRERYAVSILRTRSYRETNSVFLPIFSGKHMLEADLSDSLHRKAVIMKRKHGREKVEDLQIKIITDPKKLAWLKAKIETQKIGRQSKGA